MGAQTSYDSLMHDALGVRLSKSASFTRWDRRPLSGEQLSYARGDVEQLLELADELERRLRSLGRLEWAREECAVLESQATSATCRRCLHACRACETSAPGRGRSRARSCGGARRPPTARPPVQGVPSDAALVEIATQPRTCGELEQIAGRAPPT